MTEGMIMLAEFGLMLLLVLGVWRSSRAGAKQDLGLFQPKPEDPVAETPVENRGARRA